MRRDDDDDEEFGPGLPLRGLLLDPSLDDDDDWLLKSGTVTRRTKSVRAGQRGSLDLSPLQSRAMATKRLPSRGCHAACKHGNEDKRRVRRKKREEEKEKEMGGDERGVKN
jgi:hypothetical protein